MKILITGGEGFIGSNLVPSLLEEGYEVSLISRSRLDYFEPHPKLTVLQGSFENEKLLDRCLPGTDSVIHLAYSTVPENSMKDPVHDINSNVIPTLNLINKMSEHRVRKIVFVSSGGVVYGNRPSTPISEDVPLNPISSYGISKMMIEKNIVLLAERFGIDHCIFRIANAYGPGQHNRKNQGVINIWLKQINNGAPITLMGDGEVIRDYIHVKDIVHAFLLMLRMDIKGVFNIGTGIGTSLNQLIADMEKITGKKAVIEMIPDRKYDVECNILDYTKYHTLTGWKPEVDVRMGMEMQLNS